LWEWKLSKNVLAVTGHRPDKLGNEWDMRGEISQRVYHDMANYIETNRPSQMISGMALGVDMLWAALAIKEDIPLLAAIPFEGQEKAWPQKSQDLYHSLLSKATEVVAVCPPGYAAWKMQKRNMWMVDNCDLLVAVWDGTDGGTANCYRYAESVNKPIFRIKPWRPN
jgi:uncharacterized phage-like protein YoqJ